MSEHFRKIAEATNGEKKYQFSWMVSNRHRNSVYLGITGEAFGSGVKAFAANYLSLDDAEAIGYSLLYAVKLQRDKEARDE